MLSPPPADALPPPAFRPRRTPAPPRRAAPVSAAAIEAQLPRPRHSWEGALAVARTCKCRSCGSRAAALPKLRQAQERNTGQRRHDTAVMTAAASAGAARRHGGAAAAMAWAHSMRHEPRRWLVAETWPSVPGFPTCAPEWDQI
eukprot:350027-Chlamydomonas_euryale.AAC.3